MDLTNLDKEKKNRRKTSPDMSTMVYGKVPPQAKDLEEAVLGGILLERAALDTVIEILKAECFYVDAHQRIFRAMQALSRKSQPIDMLTVVEELRSREELDMVGGPYYVTKLTNAVVSSANAEWHCRIILQKYYQREMIRICGETISNAYEDSTDAFDLMQQHEKMLTEISVNKQDDITSLDTEMVKASQRIMDRMASDDHITGIPSGFDAIDHVTHGWQETDLIILAARPAVGKTAFAINIARNAALHPLKPVKVAFFSLEMSKGQITERMLSAESEIWLDKIMTGRLEEWEQKNLYTSGIQKLSGEKIFFDDTPALNVFELRAKCRKLKRLHNVGLIIVDYLQLMSGTNEGRNSNREQEISTISRNLKALAKELKVPIIALSQMSREVEKRKNEGFTPKLSDLRESGAIEQDADMVMFMYRPEYHDINSNENGESTQGETHIKIAKHRNGKLETIKLTAKLHIQKFVTYEQNLFNQKTSGPAFLPIGSRKSLDDDITF